MSRAALAVDDFVEHLAEVVAEIGPLERQFDGGAKEVELVADVEAALVEREGVDGLLLEQQADARR